MGRPAGPAHLVARSRRAPADTLPPAGPRRTCRRLAPGGILGWQARIAAPDTRRELGARLRRRRERDRPRRRPGRRRGAALCHPGTSRSTMSPPRSGCATGGWRVGRAQLHRLLHRKLHRRARPRSPGVEPLSFRMQMLGDNPRLARCLTTAAAIGGWDGGGRGSGHGDRLPQRVRMPHRDPGRGRGRPRDQRMRVLRAVCAVDCGRVVNPDIVRQQIEGGLDLRDRRGDRQPDRLRARPARRRAASAPIGLPTLRRRARGHASSCSKATRSRAGSTELGVPAAAPAVANALSRLTGRRLRTLPLVVGG